MHFSQWKINCLIIEISLDWGYLAASHCFRWISDSHCSSMNTVQVTTWIFWSAGNSPKIPSCFTEFWAHLYLPLKVLPPQQSPHLKTLERFDMWILIFSFLNSSRMHSESPIAVGGNSNLSAGKVIIVSRDPLAHLTSVPMRKKDYNINPKSFSYPYGSLKLIYPYAWWPLAAIVFLLTWTFPNCFCEQFVLSSAAFGSDFVVSGSGPVCLDLGYLWVSWPLPVVWSSYFFPLIPSLTFQVW